MKKLKTPQEVQRRNFLKTVASSGIAVSALKASTLGLSLMASRAGMAAGPNGIKRIVFFYIPDGSPPGEYVWNNGSLGPTSLPLASVKDNIILVEDCTTGGNGHSDGGMGTLGGAHSGIGRDTFDIHLEKVLGGNTPFPSLHIGVESNADVAIGMRSGERIIYNDNPVTVFERLFAGGVATGGPEEKRFKSALDHNKAELEAIKAKLGTFELQRLEEHQAQIEKVIKNFEESKDPLPGCDDPTQETYSWNGNEIGEFTKISNMQCENIVAAFKCGLTNIATLHLGNHQAEFTVSEHSEIGTYHTGVHNFAGKPEEYSQYRAYFTERLAYMIELLRDTLDENQESLLETTLLLQVTCMGHGDAHNQANAPFTIASGSKVSVGRSMSIPHGFDLLDTVSVALGVEGSVPKYSNGEFAGILKK
ncbi:DUF1552 domain-containing protein [Marinicellulosiphila megalodicopiae]|uniref:DUF1552 domain-containing protein n=1 Tax=Marinicellulosiphila megalodicopiae TaxID=2724896 RepID=UPI003BB0EF28